MREYIQSGGLWREDIEELISNPLVKDLKVGKEIDDHHLFAKYYIKIVCRSCQGTRIKMRINSKYCREYHCLDCESAWVSDVDFQIWRTQGGPEIMKEMFGKWLWIAQCPHSIDLDEESVVCAFCGCEWLADKAEAIKVKGKKDGFPAPDVIPKCQICNQPADVIVPGLGAVCKEHGSGH